MAYPTNKYSVTAGATFSSGDLYKAVGVNSSGDAVLYHNAAGTTDGAPIAGTLYSFTATTSAAGSESVVIGHGPVVKAFAAGSTEAPGSIVTWSTDDSNLVIATTNEPYGTILRGSSGSTGRIVWVVKG